jgi:hypothetical protein
VMGAVGAGELHASLDAGDGVEALHNFECSLLARERKARGVSSEGNDGGVLMWTGMRRQTLDLGPDLIDDGLRSKV